jgi:hypothetical protein
MLVFDERYLYPLIPLILAVAARFLASDSGFNHLLARRISWALVVFGICVSLAYRSSSFRVQTRDFQVASYQSGAILKNHGASGRLVGIGSGPYPEHGVGWEAVYQAAYFGEQRLVATANILPATSEFSSIRSDLAKADPDAIVVWGQPDDIRYSALKQDLSEQYGATAQTVFDPAIGEAGFVLFTR